jgi:H+-transporting ATPase
MTGQTNPYETNTTADVLSELKVQVNAGLTDEEVKRRQISYGLNEVGEKKQLMIILFLKHFWGLTAIMLEITIFFSFLLQKYIDVYLIGGLMLFNAVIGFIQESKAARTVQALKQSLQVLVRVLRNTKWQQVPGSQLVPGDIIRIRTGDFITADAKIIEGKAEMDQSALTGESMLISKNEGDLLFSGSVVKNGECSAVVTSTGVNTFFGKTIQLVQMAKPRLHMEEVVASVVKILFLIVLVFVGITFVVSFLRGETLLSMLPLILILLVTAVPVAMPAMFTVSMAKGSQQLAAKGILVSRLSASEDAATLTTLCIDKTGTITKNKLSVRDIKPAENITADEILIYGVMASVAANKDPIDMAFLQKAEENKIDISGYLQTSFTPFSATIKRTEATVQKDGRQFKVMKGAYNTLKELCNIQQSILDNTVDEWAAKGFKTVAVAFQKENIMTMAGIVALIDPPLNDSLKMITEIKKLGVTIKMLTGDALQIAKEIAIQVGIGNDIVPAGLLRELAGGSDSYSLIIDHDGFAEVLPEDKFSIVKTLQQHKEITGMTGDGVNDAPALKQAEVGIAVKSATDAAKQAASVILLTEGLEPVINLITVGRTIHHRITNWVLSKISKTIFTVVFVCVAYLFTGKFVVGAFDMVLLLFIIDFVTLTLSTDIVSWSKKPETWNIKPMVKQGFLLGLFLIAESLVWLFIGKKCFEITNLDELHSFGFAILFFASIFNIFVVRTPTRFYKQPIGKNLLWSITADIVFACIILSIGLPGFTALPVLVTGSSLFYFAFCSLIINDWLKLRMH